MKNIRIESFVVSVFLVKMHIELHVLGVQKLFDKNC